MAGRTRRPIWLTDKPFVCLPASLLLHPLCRPAHIRIYAALARIADYTTGEVPPIGPKALAASARVSFHSIRGNAKYSVCGLIPDLVGWGFLEALPAPRKQVHVRLLPAPQSVQLTLDIAIAPPARDRDPPARDRDALPLITDSSSDLSEREEPDGSPVSATTNHQEQTEQPRGHWACQYYVEHFRARTGKDPLPEDVAQIGKLAKQLEAAKRSREEINAGIDHVLDTGKAAGLLKRLVVERELVMAKAANNGRVTGHTPFRNASDEEWEQQKELLQRQKELLHKR